MTETKVCMCDWHKEYKFLLSLESKLDKETYEQLYKYFEEKWYGEEDLEVAKAKLSGQWPGWEGLSVPKQ